MKNWKKIILMAFVAGVIGGSVGLYLFFKPVSSTAKLDTEVRETATVLFQQYSEDENSANARFLGKVVEVRGKVIDIRTTDAGKPALVLETDDAIFGVLCELEDEKAAKSLQTGSEITVKGVCTGMLLDVVLTRCVIL